MKEYTLQEIFDLPEGIEFINADAHFEVRNGVLYNWFKPNDKQSVRLTKMYVHMKFIKVQEPVSFMDVINSNKLCRVEYENCDTQTNEGFQCLDSLLHFLSSKYPPSTLREIIKDGRWYLEA